jgi:hypothetical protein
MAEIGPSKFSMCLSQWMSEITPDPMHPDHSHDILKGMLWAASVLEHSRPIGEIGRFSEKCFQKVANTGARSVKLGNAALWALSAMVGEPRAIAELFRLHEKIKYASARKLIDARLSEMAERSGATVEELEDRSLPLFGLDRSSRLAAKFGDVHVELAVTSTETTQHWFNATGKPIKSPPADIRGSSEFAAWRRQAKDIEAARQAQVLRLEQSWVEDRSWTFADWRMHFLDHPLRKPIVDALIWQIGDNAVMPEAGALWDVTGRGVAFQPGDRVRLWHPLNSEPQQVLAWRARILERGLTQPIKQAHREIYVLTDAERTTRIYSNRFAAHILRQHQLKALCQARGWKYALMGLGSDTPAMPHRALPKHGLTVEYHIELVNDGRRLNYAALHVASDQVQFHDTLDRPVALDEIAPIVFSEVLRDVDLFVAVTSVANDPGWVDGGPRGRHGSYWREWAFGELGQSAATRKELIGWLAPKLSIADKLKITDKFLIVTGKRQNYAIHFGSSHIQILPSYRYLCIVPDRAPPEASNIRLPFAGDGLLSAILAKAFLLVDESKIKDGTILRQL